MIQTEVEICEEIMTHGHNNLYKLNKEFLILHIFCF